MADVLLPGFTPDPEDARCGFLRGADGHVQRVFLKRSRTPERHACERRTLELIRQAGAPPVPQLLATFPDAANPLLALS